jgi:hypothetical protein
MATDPEVRVRFRYQIFWNVVCLERGPLSLESTTEELIGRNSSGSSLESREYVLGIRYADHVAPSIHKMLALSSSTGGGRSVGVVCSRTQYIMAAVPISMAYLINLSYQSVGLYVYTPIVARQRLSKNVTAAMNTSHTFNNIRTLVGHVVCCVMRVVF